MVGRAPQQSGERIAAERHNRGQRTRGPRCGRNGRHSRESWPGWQRRRPARRGLRHDASELTAVLKQRRKLLLTDHRWWSQPELRWLGMSRHVCDRRPQPRLAAGQRWPTKTISLQQAAPRSTRSRRPVGLPSDRPAGARAAPQRLCLRIGAYEVAPPLTRTTAASKITNTGATLNALGRERRSHDRRVRIRHQHEVRQDRGRQGRFRGDVRGRAGEDRQAQAGHRVPLSRRGPTMDGTATGADGSFRTTSAPMLSRLKLKPSPFSTKGAGTTISYTDSEPATTTFEIVRGAAATARRSGRSPTRTPAAPTRVAFSGRFDGVSSSRAGTR